MTKKLYNNKIKKSFVSLVAIIILLSSILATTIFYGNNITSNVVRENSIANKPTIKEVRDINELSQLNEGWYEIRYGFVFYLDTFNSYVPLYIKVLNPEQQNGLLVVDEYGNLKFDETFRGLPEKEIVDGETEINDNQLTGNSVDEVTGAATVQGPSVRITSATGRYLSTQAKSVTLTWSNNAWYVTNCVPASTCQTGPLREDKLASFDSGKQQAMQYLMQTGYSTNTVNELYNRGLENGYTAESVQAPAPSSGKNIWNLWGILSSPAEGGELEKTSTIPLAAEDKKIISESVDSYARAIALENKRSTPTQEDIEQAKRQYIDSLKDSKELSENAKLQAERFVREDYKPSVIKAPIPKQVTSPEESDNSIILKKFTNLPEDVQLGETSDIVYGVETRKVYDFDGEKYYEKYKDGQQANLDDITLTRKNGQWTSKNGGLTFDDSSIENGKGIIFTLTPETSRTVALQELKNPPPPPPPPPPAPAPGISSPSKPPKFYDISGTRELTTQPASGQYIVEYVGQNKRELYDGPKLVKTQVKEGTIWKDVQAPPTPKSYDIFSNNNLVATITANSDQEAKDRATLYGLQNVRVSLSKVDVASSNLQQYYISVALANGITVPVGGKDYDDAVKRANQLAADSKTEVVSIEPTKFIVKDATNPGSEYVIEGAANANIARKTAEITYGIKAGSPTEQKPFAKGGGQTYLITLLDNDNKPIKTIQINAKDEDEAYDIATNHLNANEKAVDYTVERKISLEEFKKLNPGISQQNLEQAYKQKYIQGIEETPKEKQVALKPIVDEQGNSIAWVVDGKLYTKEGEARAKFNEIIAQNEAKVIAKEQKLTLLKETGLEGRPLAKDSSGNIYELIDKDDKRSYVKTNEYTVYEEIKKDDNILVISTVYKRASEKDPYQQVKIQVSLPKKGESYLFVDPESAKEIKEAFNKGLVVEGEGKNQGANYISFITIKDKEGKVLSKTTLIKSDKPLEVEGIKTIEKFGTAYYYNGNEITKTEYDKLKPEEKSKATVKSDVTVFKETREKEEGTLKYLTTYQFDTIFDAQKNPIRIYEAIKTDSTGEVVEFTYGEGDKKIIIKTPEGVNALDLFKSTYQIEGDTDDKNLLDKASTHLNQYVSRQFFANVERVFTEFQGLGYYATLFFDEDSLLEWRDNVDRAFATLYLGTEYWSSAICGNYLDGEDEGIAYAETPQGLAQVAAHIEATRTEPIITPTGREFIYKITFNVRNGDFDKDPRAPAEMKINVVLKGKRTAVLFRQEQTVKRGSTFGRTGRNAIAKTSSTLYNEICMTFDKVPLRWKISNKEICNTIQESAGAPTLISTSAGTTSGTGGGGGTGDTNDI